MVAKQSTKARSREGLTVSRECPTCRQPAAMSCRCPRLDMACASGHEWHHCSRCRGPIVGPSDHGRPADECVCRECRATEIALLTCGAGGT